MRHLSARRSTGRRKGGTIFAALATLAALALAAPAAAQTFPSQPIRLIEPFAPGGPSDTIARAVGGGMAQRLGQAVVIENVPGAEGTITTARAARAAPDGYTLDQATWSTHVVSPVVYPNLS